MGDTMKVVKVLASMDDLTCGLGKEVQNRAGQDVEVTQIDQHYAVSSQEDLQKIDIGLYTYAKIGELAYRFDPNATTGIPSDFGPGYWNISCLDAVGVKLASGVSLETAVTTLQDQVTFQADAVGTSKKLFSAKVKRDATGWVLEDSNKVVSVKEETKPGATEATLTLSFDKAPISIMAVDAPGYVVDSAVTGNDMEICFLHSLNGTVETDGTLVTDSLWDNLVSADVDSTTGLITITHPASTNTTLGKTNPYLVPGSVSKHEGPDTNKFVLDAWLAYFQASHKIQPLAPLHAYVEYRTATDDFGITTHNVGITAEKGTGGSVVVNHANLQALPTAQASADSWLAKVLPNSAEKSIVSLFSFSGSKKSSYTADTAFYINSSSLMPVKFPFKAKYNFDFGQTVVPASSFEVGFEFYIIGLIEA
ncbi:lysogenic conversion protein [Vibrio phage VPMS1]|uniref:lysogenic conversion protein n=1 Tax=Vibrio phage VPMS1 TaxID=1233488 RepID=UPI0003585AC6|nr:lysogenic conversion protein [Vibrio phage VPMS1]AFV51103.1 lysogenic conversion protein [Vibrio phage VPMS1]